MGKIILDHFHLKNVQNKIKIDFLFERFRGFYWYTWSFFSLMMIILFLMQPLTWFHFMWTKYRGIEEPRNAFLRWVYDTSANIIKSAKTRTVIYVTISLALAATSVINVIECNEVKVEDPESESVLSNCISSWVNYLFFLKNLSI